MVNNSDTSNDSELVGADTATAAIVLAGGRSRRMGTDKAALDLAGRPMLTTIVDVAAQRCGRVYVVAAESSSAFQALHEQTRDAVRWITDERRGTGPLGGLAAGLAAAATDGYDLAFVCATDMPLIGTGLIDELLGAVTPATDAVIAQDATRDHPLAGVYRSAVHSTLTDLVVSGERRLTAAAEAIDSRRIAVSDPDWLLNVNAPEDMHRLHVAGAGLKG